MWDSENDFCTHQSPSINFVAHARTPCWIKDTQQSQLIFTSVLDAVNLALRQVDARAGDNRRVRFTGPHAALAAQDEEHFFVVVKVIGRAAGRNRADELRCLSATDLVVNHYAIPAIGSWLRATISETNEWRSIRS